MGIIAVHLSVERENIKAAEKIRVGIIAASMRDGWGRDAHIPSLRALPEFEITAVCTSRRETADDGPAFRQSIPYPEISLPYDTAL
jgi:predicted dehydrogenase